MNTSTPPETTNADFNPGSQSNTTNGDGKSKLIFTVFPQDATAKQIANALNELRRRQRGNVGDGDSKGNL